MRELDEIADWKEKTYTSEHAERYVTFIQPRISSLARGWAKGKIVGVRPDLRYIQIQRRAKGHGHVAVYSVDETIVNVLHIFHTAQNWRSDLDEG